RPHRDIARFLAINKILFMRIPVLLMVLACGSALADDISRIKADAEAGDAKAQYNLGTAYQQGTAARRDLTEARRWWRKAADQGYAPAQFNMGIVYARGDGVPRDLNEASRWFTLAAKQDHADALYNLGLIQAMGENGKAAN